MAWTEEQLQMLPELSETMTVNQIADYFGKAPSTVRTRLNMMGLIAIGTKRNPHRGVGELWCQVLYRKWR